MYSSIPRRNVEGPVSHAKWPSTESFRSPASSWEVDDSTAQTVSRLNSVFGFRPPTGYAKSSPGASPDDLSRYSPDLPQLLADRTPELRHDTPSDARTRTSSFGPETPPTKADSYFSSEPLVQPLTPVRTSNCHLRSRSDSCSLRSFYSEGQYRIGTESTAAIGHDAKQHPYPDPMSRSGDSPSNKQSRETPSPHQNYAVALTRNNRAVTLILTAGNPAQSGQPNITCYRQTSLPLGGPFAEFFKASEALALLQHMVNASSMSYQPFSKRERSELLLRMRTSDEGMILGNPCSNARAWTSFFSTELAAGRAWEAGTVIFPWKVLEKLMSSLNAEYARKRKIQARAVVRREMDEHSLARGPPPFRHGYGQSPDARPMSLLLACDSGISSAPMSGAVGGDRCSVSSASPPPPGTPTEVLPPKLQLVSERAKSPPTQLRRRRQNSEPVRPLSLAPPRIALLKPKACRQSLRGLHSASTPVRLEFYDSIRQWPASSHRAQVRLPPCSRFLEMVENQEPEPRNSIVV
ncbi:uncharacterized protein LY79DRAFT_516366 [Colletotrichum navitas]|uniref:Uncharacterized protein n=1 Tax=Colletotrichum navitas TaxID=681940 RepID=A0AAD8V5F6_9PEZI|nr:uncharacterized protein LY79DRAFT_516366 [Colletotrichum navitas]KAK1590224.1 hypothetical protein LY79DRAFT_516366 [Colletotrichum navitas]